jgi:predicted regulator of Ras-like GTPase activity (Roadblock/LC7/MglB family)
MSERDLQRWTREVAEDPGASSFVRLARAYRRQGRRATAREVLVRGLAHHPEHLAAHSLLALIHVEEGDPVRARDEWEIVHRLQPDHFGASRGLGFLALERSDLDAARRHLETAARVRPDDTTVAQALEVLEQRIEAARRRSGVEEPGWTWNDLGDGATPSDGDGRPGRTVQMAPLPAATWGPVDGEGRDPTRLFDSLREEGPFVGALVLDVQGMVLAGSLESDQPDRAELLGGMLNDVMSEARRASELTRMGEWEQLIVESDGATLYLAPLNGDAALVVVARSHTPTGWVVRVANRARAMARVFLEASA